MKIASSSETQGAGCSLVFVHDLGKYQAVLAGNNPLHLKKADKFAISSDGRIYFCFVDKLVSTNGTELDNRTIQLSHALGKDAIPGRYWKIPEWRYRVKLAFGLPKSKLALFGTGFTILGAGLTAYRAYHASGANQNHDHLVTRGLFILTAFGALLAWAKEVV